MIIESRDPRDAARELAAREPIFHRAEFGTRREDFERMVAADYWETGASGTVYSRGFVLDTLERRHRETIIERLAVTDFRCQRLADDLYLATYCWTRLAGAAAAQPSGAGAKTTGKRSITMGPW